MVLDGVPDHGELRETAVSRFVCVWGGGGGTFLIWMAFTALFCENLHSMKFSP